MESKLFKIGKGILLLLLIIYVSSQVSWVFHPIMVVIKTLFVPLILSVFLYYLLRPLVRFINKKLSRGLSILLVYLALISILIGFLVIIGPILQRQLYSLIDNMPTIISEIKNGVIDIQQSELFLRFQFSGMINVEELLFQLGDLISQLGINFASNVTNFVGVLANAVLVLVIVPFILFYILKDGEQFGKAILGMIREKHRKEAHEIFVDIDKTLSSYIQGQGIVCLCVGTLCYIAFLIIGLDYALLLAVIAGITNIIPYVGPWIGSVPALIVALFHSPLTALFTVIVVIIIQQIESSFISPQIIGRKLQVHPITIMFLILIAGRLAGLIGMIIAVPTYAICKVLFTHGLKIWKLKYKGKK